MIPGYFVTTTNDSGREIKVSIDFSAKFRGISGETRRVLTEIYPTDRKSVV